MIAMQQVKKSFGKRVLFDHFDLSIDDGDFVVLCGASGCGKTTLLNMIGAIEPVDSGSITVDGIPITKMKNHLKYYAQTVGFLFQNFALIEDKSVWDNLQMIPKGNRSGVSVEEALAHVGMQGKEKQKVYTLSGGEQQRIALARLMVKQCKLILADEPTGSLDAANADAVLEILQKMNKAGKTIVVVTHSEAVKQRGKRVIAL